MTSEAEAEELLTISSSCSSSLLPCPWLRLISVLGRVRVAVPKYRSPNAKFLISSILGLYDTHDMRPRLNNVGSFPGLGTESYPGNVLSLFGVLHILLCLFGRTRSPPSSSKIFLRRFCSGLVWLQHH